MTAGFQEELVASTSVILANVPVAKESHMAKPRVGRATQLLQSWER